MIRDVTCSVRCLDVRTVAETGRIEITGANLGSVGQGVGDVGDQR